MSTARVPVVPIFLLRLLLPGRWRDSVVDDLIVAFHRDRARRGRLHAHCRLWREAMAPSNLRLRRRARGSAASARSHGRGHRRPNGSDGPRHRSPNGRGAEPHGPNGRGGLRASLGVLSRDVRYAMRSFRRAPAFAMGAILTLALGIGATTAIFSIVNAMVFRGLPGVSRPDDIVALAATHASFGQLPTVSHPNLRDFGELAGVFDGAISGTGRTVVNLASSGASERVEVDFVSDNFFDVIGVVASIGRPFREADAVAGGASGVIVLKHAYWQRRFGGDPGIIGQTLVLNDHPVTVVGVAAPEFVGVSLIADVAGWVPFSALPELAPDIAARLERRGSNAFYGFARLLPGVTVQQAAAATMAIAAELERQYPDDNEGVGVVADEDPIGKRFVSTVSGEPIFTIVGVVASIRERHLGQEPHPAFYLPATQFGWTLSYLVARVGGDPASMLADMRTAVWAVDPDVIIDDLTTMQAVVHETMGNARFFVSIFSIFAVVAALLGIVGVYSVVSYTTSQRTREIGLRVALGATPAAVVRAVMLRAFTPVTAGVTAGLLLAFGVTRFLQALLFEVTPTDPLVFGLVALTLALVGISASLVPARRAAARDPLVALRE